MFPPSTSLWQAQTAQIMAGDHADGNSHHVGSRPILETPTLTTTQRLPEKGNTSRSEKRKNVSSNVEMEHRGSSEGGMTGQEKLRPIQNGSFFGAEAFSSVVGRTKFPSKGPSYPPRQNYPPLNPADQNPPCNTLYVGNLPIDTSEEELKAMFSKQRGYKRLCFRTKQNGPMCFVEFEDIFFATKALHELYGQLLHNSVKGGIRLSFSKNPLGVRSGPGQRITTPKDGLSKLISSASGRVMTVDEGDISRNKPMKPRCDSNDSGFESLPPQQGLPNALHANEGIPAPTSDLPTSSTSATESNVGTVPSVGTTMLSDIVQESIAHICEDLYHKLEPEICPTSFGAMIGNFGELIKAFAIQLGLDQSHHMGPSIMYFVYKHHNEICALLKGKFMGGDENGPESPQGRRGNMSLAEKMEMWHQEFSQEHSVFREDAPSKFEGVDDLEDDDPVSNSELSLYSKIILKSSAYRWLVSTLQTQASLCYGDGHSTMAGDEIRQMVLKQLQTGTISKKQPPRTFATCFVLPGYWNTLRSRLNFYDANGQTIRLQNIVVLSVSSDTDAQIATAGHYMRQMWQDAGTLLLQGFQDLVDGRIGECIEVQVHDTAYIKIQIIGSDVNVVCHGPAYFAAQCAAQLCWIDCAIQPNRPLPVVRTPCLTQIGAAKFLISSLDETTKRHKVLAHIERTNTCWQRFDPLVCVWGFPIARRPEGFSGVELPLSPANNSLFLSPDLSLEWPVKRLVLNQWAATLCCVGRINSSWLWHLERTCTCSAEWMENYSGDLHRLTIDDIARDQHILGYCNETSGLLNNRQDETARGQESNSNKESIETVINTPLMKSLDCNSFTTHDAQSDSVDTDLLSISSFSCDIDDDALQLDKCATPIIDIVALQLVSKIACRQAPTLEKPLCDQESMSNAQGTASISTQGIQRGSPNSAPNPGKRKASDQDEGDDGEEPSQNRRPEKRSARGEGSSRQQTFACPFWKRDPIKHRTCFHAKLLTSSRVKQHLSRSHTPRFYCQLCFAVFKEEQAQEQHVIQRSCIRVPGMQLDGISPDQQLQLSRKPKLTLTEEERWYRIWDIVLPHDPRPKSPYIDSQLSDCCARFREHWQNLGPELLLREIQSSGVLASAAMDEATTARLLRRILARGLDMIWESWAPPSSSIIQQNLLQQLPATPAYTQEHNSLGPVSSTTSTSSIVDVAPEIHGNLHITPWVGTHHQRVPETPDLSTTGTYTVSQMVFSNPSASEMVQRLEQTIESTNMLDFDDADILDSSHDFGADIGDIGSWVDL